MARPAAEAASAARPVRARHSGVAPECRGLRASRTSPSRRCRRSIAASRRRCAWSPTCPPTTCIFLAAHDADPFNRWQAVQTLATRLLVDNVAAIRPSGARDGTKLCSKRSPRSWPTATLEPAFAAQALTLPSEADIAREIGARCRSRRDLPARRALRAGHGPASRRRAARTLSTPAPTPAPTVPTRRAPGDALCAMSASISWSQRRIRQGCALGARTVSRRPTT